MPGTKPKVGPKKKMRAGGGVKKMRTGGGVQKMRTGGGVKKGKKSSSSCKVRNA